MKISLLIYGVLFLIALFGVFARIMSRKAIIIPTFRAYLFAAIAFVIPLLIVGVGLAISTYDLSLAFSNKRPNLMMFVVPVLCWSIFVIAAAVGSYYGSVRLMGEIILINVEEEKVFDVLRRILDDGGIAYLEKQTQFHLNQTEGSVRLVTMRKQNFFFLQFTNAKQYMSTIFDGLKKDLENYQTLQIPWWSLTLFIPLLPALVALLNEVPNLKDILVIDLSSFGEWPRIIGGYGSWGMYLSGQIMAVSLLLLAIRLWIKKPFVLTSTKWISWVGTIVLMTHIVSLLLVSLINYDLHIGPLFFLLILICLIPYLLNKIQTYYGFMNILPEQVSDTLMEVLRRRGVPFSETRHAIVLEDGTEFKLQVSKGQVSMEISKPENHKELIKEFLSSLRNKPATILVAQNLLILFAALMIMAYWFSPYLLHFLFRSFR
jgi:hypothetical protein